MLRSLAFLLASAALPFAAQVAAHAATPCADLPHSDHPRATLHQGQTTAVIFLPDPTNGYYRGPRFDWSGVVPCLNVAGHDFFGEWFPRYDPLLNDSITGPVEEFRSEDGALGYDAAKPGEPFVKIGVGVLRRVDDTPYKFGTPYPILDSGHWSSKPGPDSVTFTQVLQAPHGVAYRYTKVLRLADNGHTLLLEHTLTNTGTAPIDTSVYDHDFFMLDHRTTGPGMRVHFPFAVHTTPPPSGPPAGQLEPFATTQGNDVVYQQTIPPHHTASSYLAGFGPSASDYDITVSDSTTGLAVQQTSDHPISKLYLWSIPTTTAPEAYIHLALAPGQTTHWRIAYRFTTPPAPAH